MFQKSQTNTFACRIYFYQQRSFIVINSFVLPLKIGDIESVTECWTYNRLTIVKNSPYYRDWIASHYNLFVDSKLYNFTFGENNKIFPTY